MRTKLRMSGSQWKQIRTHLFPNDGCEAVAVALCGRLGGDAPHVLVVHEIIPIAYADCTERTPDRVSWPTSSLVPHFGRAIDKNLAVVKIHSHPGGYRSFSRTDDASDKEFFHSVYGWFDATGPHGSAVMLPTGEMFGRVVHADGTFEPMASIAFAGDDFHFWPGADLASPLPAFTQRHAQLFGQGTTARLKFLSAAVIGCSGTGSPLVEQLVRLGIGRLILVDPDVVEEKNLNRILHATMEDAKAQRPKVEVLAREIERIGLGTKVVPLQRNLVDAEVVRQVAGCDVLFGCMDGAEGRNLLNRLATFYCLPYFDVGVRLDADGNGGVDQVCGGVHYLQPGGSSLLSRGVISSEDIDAESILRTDPEEYARKRKAGYIHRVNEDRPAVVSVNMHFASLGVNEFLARLHPYRDDPNADYAWVSISLSQMHRYANPDGAACPRLSRYVGRGDQTPLLDMPFLS